MSRPRNFFAWTMIGTLLVLALPISGTAVAGMFFSNIRLIHVPLHSLVEGAGGLIAVATAGVLIAEAGRKSQTDHYIWMVVGLLSMGMLDLFHAASAQANHFYWLRSCATFFGGMFFGMVWIPPRTLFIRNHVIIAITVVIVAMIIGVSLVASSEYLPVMRSPQGEFARLAITLNSLSGVGFVLSAIFFIRRFLTIGEIEDWLFSVQSLLFGVSGFFFQYTVVWDVGWWWWHLLRLSAYVAALAYGLRAFRDADRELRAANHKLALSNVELDRSVEERTAKLQATEERFELAVRGSTDGIWDWNILTNEVYFSPRLKELLGHTDEEIPNLFESFESRLHPDDHDWVLRAVDEHLTQRKPYDVEYRLRMKSGEYRWFRARGQAIWNGDGKAYRMAGSITDTTEEYRLRERFRLAVEASPAALIMMRRDGRIEMANSRCLKLFGYQSKELVGELIEVLVPERFRAGHPARRNQFFNDPEQRAMGAELDLLGVRKDGSEFPVKVGLSPVQTEEGPAVICGILDITDQKKMIEIMRLAKEAAESASRAKSSFLANMSHEIRTPMNGIIGMAQLLGQTDLRAHQRDYLATINESAHILLRLLNDILDFSKIEAGKLELENEVFRISECVARASQMLALRSEEKGLELVCRISPEIPDHLIGDSGRIQQVLVNLLGNAIKFTDVGEVYLNINAESISRDTIRLRFSVSDTGIGISADKKEQIFRPFEQAESSTTRRFGGTGLGLAISRQLVEMMHGEISVESELGRGSTFTFTAELGVAADQHRHEPAEMEVLVDLPVMIVDDNPTNRRILCELLQYWHMKPLLADSAAAARQLLHTSEISHRSIRLILLDHHMPQEDGLQFAESIHGTLNHETCPIIMISSGSTPIDADLWLKYGIDRFMTKPIIASELLNEMLRQFGKRMSFAASATKAEPANSKIQPRKVLLVEDNEINRRVALALLHSRGHQVAVAENGQEAVNMLMDQPFDVVLMDMQMPVMNGVEATAVIRRREQETGGHQPIVAMTAEALKGDRERCLAAGMDDYISKPIQRVEMYRVVERFPARCLSGDSLSMAASSNPVSNNAPSNHVGNGRHLDAEHHATNLVPQPTSNHADSTALPAIDWKVAQARLEGGLDVLQTFIDLARNEVTAQLADMRRAVENRDCKLLCRAAHTMKSSVSYFGADALARSAQQMETAAREGRLDDCVGFFAALEREQSQFIKELNAGPPA